MRSLEKRCVFLERNMQNSRTQKFLYYENNSQTCIIFRGIFVMKHSYFYWFLFLLMGIFASTAQAYPHFNPYRNYALLDKNQVKIKLFNYGSFSAAGMHTYDFEWHGLGYAYEFTFFFGAEVPVPKGSHPDAFPVPGTDSTQWAAHVISDGATSNGPESNPDGTEQWRFQPILQSDDGALVFFDPSRFDSLPTSCKTDLNGDGIPDLWPNAWFNASAGAFEWPGLWQNGQVIGDLETIYGMDDRDNREFEYYPFPDDSTRKGLGIEVDVRPMEIQDFYQDILFAVLRVKNVSAYDLPKMIFGLNGDPHVGGWTDYNDDHANYNPDYNLVYVFDTDGKSMISGKKPGYFGIMFLQTPGNSSDGIDNDGDGMVDESQWDGIDNDGDWDAKFDDVGADGIPNTGDIGEGDGVPTEGEPNFDFTDADEADMIGLTNASYIAYGEIYMRDDEKIWQNTVPGTFTGFNKEGDRMLTASSGYFSLPAHQEIQLGIAFIFGEDYDALLENCRRAQRFYNHRLGSYSLPQPLILSEALSGKSFTGTIPLRWKNAELPSDAFLECAVSKDNGQNWMPLAENIPNTGTQTLNVDTLPSSPFYKMRIRAFAKGRYYFFQTPDFFTIDNSGDTNIPPGLIVFLQNKKILSETVTIRCKTGDVDGDKTNTKLVIRSAIVNDTLLFRNDSLRLNTRFYPNGTYDFVFLADDGQHTTRATRMVYISNTYHQTGPSLLAHIRGAATGNVDVQLVNSFQFQYHLYKITFKDSLDATYYSVFDSTAGRWCIQNDPLPEADQAGRTFDGLRLVFNNDKAALDTSKTGWNAKAKTNLQFKLVSEHKPVFPYDLQIRFYDHVVDTCLLFNIPVKYKIWNLTEKCYMPSVVLKKNPDSTRLSTNDNVFIVDSSLTKYWRMEFIFNEDEIKIEPTNGDIFSIFTRKPFSSDDVFLFDAAQLTAVKAQAQPPQHFSLEQNYPNPFNPSTSIRFRLARASHVRLTVYNVLGQRVKTLVNGFKKAGTYQVTFDASNLASGVYIYRLTTDKGFVQAKKMLLIR